MRRLMAWAVAGGSALACCGCDVPPDVAHRAQQALGDEVFRHAHLSANGPLIVASIVGASAPAGGPAGLHALVTDQMWRALVAKALPEVGRVPAMLEVPDPNRPVKAGADDRGE